jgi:L-malate glycosyltransferase
MGPSVLIVQRRLTHYRVPLFERMRAMLDGQGVRLDVAYGQPTVSEAKKNDSGVLDWGVEAPNRYIYIKGSYLCYQQIPRSLVRGANLVVVTQENRLLANYLLYVKRRQLKTRLALWGHGANMQGASPQFLRERFKRWYSNKVDWWFAYTELSRRIVADSGFPCERITCLNNAIDTRWFLEYRRSLSPSQIQVQKRKLGVEGAPVGVYLGSLHAEKRIEFLQEAADVLHARMPTVRLVAIGDGPQRESFSEWAASRPWVRYVGRVSDEEKVLCLVAGDVLLNPGLVGLVILDSFCAEVPLITTDCGIISPEIAYLSNDVNGVITANSVESFVTAAESLLTHRDRLEILQTGCRSAAALYSIDNMARNFSKGITQAIDHFSRIRRIEQCG